MNFIIVSCFIQNAKQNNKICGRMNAFASTTEPPRNARLCDNEKDRKQIIITPPGMYDCHRYDSSKVPENWTSVKSFIHITMDTPQ